ncbi:hypothetical protein OPKNFCMD_0217 [Methylobacterium crusticola]|uniref:Polysaccharide biosynthesis enzyme WcbI domain-containing protein n=1 Tax=Methylobacterium crusticola TaxID=1697972 RepID=A0ABQ4QS39_9HYPH|nr:WcbI family polysaccharide biosynthesis putative acetyltransferase [Methylobacterium crusticola]GJD47509.1 hypothetical protein OPKNFCMD_0217 [Methylobacterium crusticola]
MPLPDVLHGARWAVQSRLAAARRRRAGPTGSPRIMVVGICQGGAIAEAMRLLVPGSEVTFVSAFAAARRYPRLADLAAEGRRHDVVFSNTWLPRFRDGGDLAGLRAETNLVTIPTIVFSAFHPDLVMVGEPGEPGRDGLIVGPLGHAHSALALFGYLEGLAPARTEALFDAAVYRHLGYFDFWNDSVATLLALGREVGYDLDADLVRWSRRGCFMHANNHPKVHVAADLARGLLERAGIAYGACDLDSYLADDLIRAGTFPVYPAIAEHYGVQGSALFLKSETRRTGPARTMALPEFIARSYAAYARHLRDVLVCPRVSAWRTDPATRAFLRAHAGAP